MPAELGCEQVRELAGELALGIAEGQDRDAAPGPPGGLWPVPAAGRGAGGGRRRALSAGPRPSATRRVRVPGRLPAPAAAAAVVLAATLGAGSVVLATAGDCRLAEGYQAVLRQGQGASFVAAPLQGARGRVGTVFGYQGQPSWVMVTLAPSIPAKGRVQVQVLTRDGRSLSLGQAVLGGAAGSWGAQ